MVGLVMSEPQATAEASFVVSFSRPGLEPWETTLDRTLEIGRRRVAAHTQDTLDPAPFCRVAQNDVDRIVVAQARELQFSRHHLLLQPLSDGKLRLFNISSNQPAHLMELNQTLGPGTSCDVDGRSGLRLRLGDLTIEIRADEPALSATIPLHSLQCQTIAPQLDLHPSLQLSELIAADEQTRSQVLRWISETVAVLESAAYSGAFVDQTLRTIAE